MFNDEQAFLSNALDTLKKSIETLNCSTYYSVLGINNLYFFTLYKYVEQQCFSDLQYASVVDDNILKETMFSICHQYCVTERESAPLAYETRNAGFLNNFCQMLNTPYFEEEMEKPQDDPAMIFTQSLWNNYKENWKNSIQPL